MPTPTFVFESVQEGMIERAFPQWKDVYSVCTCGYVQMNLPKDTDEFHNETCGMSVRWQWAPLPYKAITGEITPITHSLVHYYLRTANQTSLRCSYCADAPDSPVHAKCKATWATFPEEVGIPEPRMNHTNTICYEPPMGPEEPYCEAHWLDMK